MEKHIGAVDFNLNDSLVTNLPYSSRVSISDYDIMVFGQINYSEDPDEYAHYENYKNYENINHWRDEISQFLEAGRNIFCFLGVFNRLFYQNDPEQEVNNYRLLPFDMDVKNAPGKRMRVIENNSTKPYLGGIKKLVNELSYKVIFEDISSYDDRYSFEKLLVTHHDDNLVSFIATNKKVGEDYLYYRV